MDVKQLISNLSDDAVSIVLVSGVGLYVAGNRVINAARPTFGQDAATVVALGAGGIVASGVLAWKMANGDARERVANGIMSSARVVSNIARQPVRRTPHQTQTQQRNGDTKKAFSGFNEFVENVFLDGYHVLLLAGTRAGKSVLGNYVCDQLAKTGNVYVLDGKPEANMRKKWMSAKKVIYDRSKFLPALKAVHLDLHKRMSAGHVKFRPYTVIIDEFQTVTGDEESEEILSDILSRGAAYGMRLIMMTQYATTANVGFSGRMAALEKNAQPVTLTNNGHRTIALARLTGGRVIPIKATEMTVPDLPVPWIEDEPEAVYDEPEFLLDTVENAPARTMHHAPVQNDTEPEFERVEADSAPVQTPVHGAVQAPVQAPVQTDTNPVRDVVERLGDDAKGIVATVVKRINEDSLASLFTGKVNPKNPEQVAALIKNVVGVEDEKTIELLVNLYAEAGKNITDICTEVWGSKNAPRFNKVKQILGID